MKQRLRPPELGQCNILVAFMEVFSKTETWTATIVCLSDLSWLNLFEMLNETWGRIWSGCIFTRLQHADSVYQAELTDLLLLTVSMAFTLLIILNIHPILGFFSIGLKVKISYWQ